MCVDTQGIYVLLPLCNHKVREVYATLNLIAVPGIRNEFSTIKIDGIKGGKGALLGELGVKEREHVREFQWHWTEPCGANFLASKPEFKFRAFFTVWEAEFSLQWLYIKNSIGNGL